MSLREYAKKREFDRTPEPKGEASAPTSEKLAFVIQEHQASHHHFDFRLELDGVLKSWAVPKGPSLDPHEHHLAIHVEDHPLEYQDFEGIIPEGNYGAGTVKIWDKGWYEARKGEPAAEVKTLRSELKKGHLTFIMHGQKLKGEFALIKMDGAAGKDAWLLVKKGDEFSRPADPASTPTVLDKPNLDNYPKKAKPWLVDPMLCTLVEEPFSRQGWLLEIKWDGYRAIASKHGSDVQLRSRLQNDFVARFPSVAEAIRSFKHDVIVDGEIVVIDREGKPHFEWLQNWQNKPQGTLAYYLFDLIWYDGRDLRRMPLRERKTLLKGIIPKNSILRYSDHIETNGSQLFAQMRRRHMEGMVAKDGSSPYHEGDRGANWLKVKTSSRQEVVIGGYTEPRGGRQYLGSLLVGVYDGGRLVYAGHSGGGIPDEQRRQLRDRLSKIERQTSPFAAQPKPNAPVHWVKPELVCEMEFSEWTSDGRMRQPRYKGLREDKRPADVQRERPQKTTGPKTATTLPFELTHPDKIFFPRHGITKGDIIDYYSKVADYILPYLKDRPCSLNRMPNGITGETFFQKNNDHLPDWVPHTEIFSKAIEANINWMVGNNLDTLLYMVQLGCVEINAWNSRVEHLDKPDWAVIDLDPEGVSFAKVIETAHVVNAVCDDWGVPTYPKTSGKTGLHLFIPLGAKYTHDQAKNLAHLIAIESNKRLPKITSVERMPDKRQHRVYIDFLQNRVGQTLAAPYSLRPTPDATVSMPLHWDEVGSDLKPTNFTIDNASRRLAQTGDLWKPVLSKGVDLEAILDKIQGIS